MATTKLTLAHPVKSDGTIYAEFDVRRPKARDLLAVARESSDEEVREVILFGWLAGVSRNAIEEMDLYDYRAFQNLYASFTTAPGVGADPKPAA